MIRASGIVAVALALRAGAAGAAPAAEAPPDSPALTHSLAVEATPVPDLEPVEGESIAVSPAPPATLEQLPLESRTHPLLFVRDHVPGVVSAADGLSIHGAEARETALFIDDARTSRLVLPLGMLERLSVLTAGYGAALADVTGGAVVASTRRETRTLSLDIGHAREMGRRSDDVTSVGVATPLVRDRLFLRVAAELQLERLEGAIDSTGFLPATPEPTQRSVRGAAKFVWLPAANQRIELLGAGNFNRQDKSSSLGIASEAQPRYESADVALSARWAGPLGRRLAGRAQLYGERNGQREQPLACVGAAECLTTPAFVIFPARYLLANWSRNSEVVHRALDLVAAVEAPLPETPWFRSSLRLMSRARASDRRATVSVPGDRVLEYGLNGSVLQPVREIRYFANDPRVGEPAFGPVRDDATSLRLVHSLEAPLSLLSRVQLVPGLALVGARARTSRGDQLRLAALAPGVTASWQVLRILPLFVRGSSVRRVDADLDFLSGTLPSPLSRSCRWNPDTSDYDRECEFNGGATGQSLGLPCSPLGLDASGHACRGRIRLPRSWESSVGFGLIPVEGLRADVDLVHRRVDGPWQTLETNRLWNVAGTEFSGYRNGRVQSVTDVSTPSSAQRRHRSLHTSITSTRGPVAASLAHVHSRNTAPAVSSTNFPDAQTLSFDDEGRHFVYGQAAVDLRGYGSVGALYAYAQGPVYSRRLPNVAAGGNENYRARVGANPGANINDPADDSVLRLPSTQQLSLQLRARGRRLLGVDVDLYLDMMQVFPTRTAVSVTVDAPLFGSASPSGPDSWYRLGLEYRY
jgi:hypothetical protein